MKTLFYFLSLLTFCNCSAKHNFVKENTRPIDTIRITLSDTTYLQCIPFSSDASQGCLITFKNIGQTGYFIVSYSATPDKKSFEGNMINGKQEGLWLHYDYFNQLINSKRNYKNGLLDGERIEYNDNGDEIMRIEHYLKGQKEGETIYYQNNKPIYKEIYKNNNLIERKSLSY